jgi:hypothetical protein
MSEENYSPGYGTPFDALVAHFEENNIRFNTDSEKKSVAFFITGDCAVYNCHLQITHDDQLVQANVRYPVSARDPKMRPLVAETLARANHGMALGSFEIDMDSGEIHYHLGQVILGGVLEDKVVGGIFITCLSTCDRYFPALMRVMFAGNTPADAVYLSELDVHSAAADSPPAAKETPAAKSAEKRAPQRKRRGSRTKSTREFPGLFEKKNGTDASPDGVVKPGDEQPSSEK